MPGFLWEDMGDRQPIDLTFRLHGKFFSKKKRKTKGTGNIFLILPVCLMRLQKVKIAGAEDR
ncbi:hypothetical protein AKJ60_00815 [candidate division MSBL1 archaeon SCGC-AAA385M11]|nr:hypothetical protein AKJ60_00815 [candidate division MSBL1 archaeon SCGC-AAA385M11]